MKEISKEYAQALFMIAKEKDISLADVIKLIEQMWR